MGDTLLNYDSVEISFNGTPVVHDISFSLQPGEILGLVGESGIGKSTLIKAVEYSLMDISNPFSSWAPLLGELARSA